MSSTRQKFVDVVVTLIEDKMLQSEKRTPITKQNIEIYDEGPITRTSVDGKISVGYTLIEVRWKGLHLARLGDIDKIEIIDKDGNQIEYLPLNRNRSFYEENGETVLFLGPRG